MFNEDISRDFKTLFELIPNSVSILNEITRGLRLRNYRADCFRAYLKLKSHFTADSDEVDEVAGRLLIESALKNPDFIFSVFLGIDAYSHRFHPFHKKVVDSYIKLDKYIGLLAGKLALSGELEQTLIIIGSDHGLTPTHSHFDSLFFLENKGYKPLYYTNIFKHYFNADSSVMVSGNSMAHYYFKNGGGWAEKTYCEDIPLIVDELANRPEIDVVCVRGRDGKIRVINDRGEALVWSDDGKLLNYKPISCDPLGYGFSFEKIDYEKALALSINTDYPDAVLQISQLFESPRTGDVVISAKPGFDLRATHENPEHHGSHGSLYKDHALVPLIINKKVKRAYARTVDVFPTIVEYLGLEVPENVDGKSLFS